MSTFFTHFPISLNFFLLFLSGFGWSWFVPLCVHGSFEIWFLGFCFVNLNLRCLRTVHKVSRRDLTSRVSGCYYVIETLYLLLSLTFSPVLNLLPFSFGLVRIVNFFVIWPTSFRLMYFTLVLDVALFWNWILANPLFPFWFTNVKRVVSYTVFLGCQPFWPKFNQIFFLGVFHSLNSILVCPLGYRSICIAIWIFVWLLLWPRLEHASGVPLAGLVCFIVTGIVLQFMEFKYINYVLSMQFLHHVLDA